VTKYNPADRDGHGRYLGVEDIRSRPNPAKCPDYLEVQR